MSIIQLKGLQGLNRTDRESYINGLRQTGIIDNTWTDSEIDRVYKNDQFIGELGKDLFNSTPDPDVRDNIFRDYILKQELDRYKNDPNIDIIKKMTPEGQLELFEHNYLTPEERSESALKSDELNDNQKALLNEAGLQSALENTSDEALKWTIGGASIGGAFSMFTSGISIPVAGAIGGALGAVKGVVGGVWDRYVSPENLTKAVNSLNESILQEYLEKDIARKRNSDEVKTTSNSVEASIREGLLNESMSYEQIDEMFESIVGNHSTDEKNPSYGSIHYEAFKDSYLKDLGEDTKIKVISDFIAMQQLHPDVALAGIDQVFQNIVADRQGVGEEYFNVLKRNAIGLANDFVQIPTDVIAAGIQAVDGDEAAQKYLEEGKIGNFDLGYFGPDYWQKAAKYNTLGFDNIEKAEKLGGLSEGINIREVGASNRNLNTVAQESLGQMHYLGYYGLMGRFTGALGRKFNINMDSKLGTIYKHTSTIVPNLSMSSQMGYEAYESTRDALMDRYNEQVQSTFNELVQPELDKVNWDAELQNYKNKHSREDEKILISDEEIVNMLKQQKVAELAATFMPIAESANADILNEVRSQSVDAFRMESAMDLLKNSVNVSTFRGWIYNNNKPLQNTIRNNELKVRFNGNTAVATKSKPRHLFLRTSAKEMAGEAFDEYLDGVTTGMAEGYNVAQFDGWLANRENPGTVDDISRAYMALSGMAMGIRNSFNEDNIYEATLGALSPWMPLFNRGSAKAGSTWRPFITSGIYEEYVSQSDRYYNVERKVAGINQFLTDNEDRINNIAKLNAPNRAIEVARLGGDEKALKDAEQHQIISLATIFNAAKDNAADADIVQEMSATVNKLINDEYSDEEKKQLGNEFINQPENQNSGMTVEEGYERMRHNAQKLVDTAKKIKEVEAKIDKHPNSENFSLNVRNHLIALAMQQEDWETRLNSITKELGIGNSQSSTLTISDMANKDDATQLLDEILQSKQTVSDNISDTEEKIKQLEVDRYNAKNNKKLGFKAKKAELAEIDNLLDGYNQALVQQNKERDRLSSLATEAKSSLDNWSDDKKVLSADEIMNSSATKISYMIENKSKFNAEQRTQIDKAVNRLTNNDPNFLAKLDDASRIALSIEEGKRATTAIQEGPNGYNLLVDAIEDAKIKAQIRKEANRFKNQVFMDWDAKSPEQILSDKNINLDLIEEYKKRNNGARYSELQNITDVLKLQKQLIDLINKDDKVLANALKQSIVGITSSSRNRDEAISLLNETLKNKSIPEATRDDIQELLDMAKILDKASSVTFKQEKEEIKKKEEKRRRDEEAAAAYDANKAAQTKVWADEEAAKRASQSKVNKVQTDSNQEVAEEVETIQDNGREVAEEVDRIEVGREPVSQIDEEVVDIEYTPTTESLPSSDIIIERELDKAEKEGIINDVREESLDVATKTGNAQEGEFTGNTYSRYRVIDKVVKLREDTEKITGKLKAIFEWFDSANIKYQEVIDNELNAISKLDPDVKICKVKSVFNATNDAAMRDVYMLVVEYTDEIAKIHKTDDSIIESNNKKWLVIGSLGYNPSIEGQEDRFKALTVNGGPLDRRSKDFWRNNPTESFYVDEVAHTKISRINPGRIVRETMDGASGTKPVSELLKSGGLQLRNAKWAIAKGKELKVVGRVESGSILNESGVAEKSGTVYLLIPSAGGKYIASYIIPAFTDTLKVGSELHSIITNALTKLADDNHKVRYEGLTELFQYIYLDGKNNNILIGTEENNTITIIQEGRSVSYKVDDPNVSKFSIIQELLKSHFRVQVNLETLTDRDRLSLYDEGGALLTDLQKYGVSGADFTVYEMDENGNPNIPDNIINVPNVQESTKPRTPNSVIYNGKLYTKDSNGWRDFDNNYITDPVKIRHLQYMNEIVKGKAPYSSTDTHNQYVFSFDRDNPIVIAVTKKSGRVTELTKEQAIEYLDRQEVLAEERAREEALEEAMQSMVDEEVVNLNSDIVLLEETQTKGFEEYLYGSDEDTEESIEEEAEKDKAETFDSTKLNPSKSKPDDKFISVNDILVDHFSEFFSIIMEKQEGGEWLDFPMDSNEDLIKYLENKGMQTIGIPDLDVWFDILKNCRK